MTKLLPIVASLAACLTACSKSKSDAPAADKAAPPAELSPTAVADANGLVPAELKSKLVFEKAEVSQKRLSTMTTFQLAAPHGWTQKDKKWAELVSPDAPTTEIKLSTDCNGECKPKNWAKASHGVFDQFSDATVVKSETGATSRSLIATQKDSSTVVVYAWWQPDASQYQYCTATLDAPLAAAAPAFLKACQAVAVASNESAS